VSKGHLQHAHAPDGYVDGKDVRALRALEPVRSIDSNTCSKIFDFRPSLFKSLTRAERKIFRDRLLLKLTGERRGRLRLPLSFPKEIRELSELTTGQLRHAVYRVCSSYGSHYVIDHRIVRYIQQVLPGVCRLVRPNVDLHAWQSRVAKPLKSEDWPRLGARPAWPSSPTFNEMLEMQRAGLQPISMLRPPVRLGHVTVSEFNDNAGLRARLVAKQVVGIRSDVGLPRIFLDRFRYRRGFLILTVRYNLPAGLVRFLTGQWIRNPHNLWLREKVSFKHYLKNAITI